jgi:hypothetical protein
VIEPRHGAPGVVAHPQGDGLELFAALVHHDGDIDDLRARLPHGHAFETDRQPGLGVLVALGDEIEQAVEGGVDAGGMQHLRAGIGARAGVGTESVVSTISSPWRRSVCSRAKVGP